MIQKARLFGDSDTLKKMESEDDPVALKHLGKTIKDFSASIWKENIDGLLAKGLSAKFTQNEDLSMALKDTCTTILVEANPNDKIFGVGQSLFGKNIWDKQTWCGENKMGKAERMNVRENLD